MIMMMKMMMNQHLQKIIHHQIARLLHWPNRYTLAFLEDHPGNYRFFCLLCAHWQTTYVFLSFFFYSRTFLLLLLLFLLFCHIFFLSSLVCCWLLLYVQKRKKKKTRTHLYIYIYVYIRQILFDYEQWSKFCYIAHFFFVCFFFLFFLWYFFRWIKKTEYMKMKVFTVKTSIAYRMTLSLRFKTKSWFIISYN